MMKVMALIKKKTFYLLFLDYINYLMKELLIAESYYSHGTIN